jgi:hypothetical protein
MFLLQWLACTSDEPTTPTGGGTTTTVTDTDTSGGTTVPTTDSGTTRPAGTVRLTVVGGYGSGFYPPGSTVHVWADLDPQREILTSWTGDTGALASPAEWNSSLVLADADVTVTAQLEAADWTPDMRAYTLEGRVRDVWVIAAADPRGVAMFFHGAAYAVDQLRSNAGSTLVMQLVRAGWTVVGLESEAEAVAGTGGWSSVLNFATNNDLRNVAFLQEQLIADGTADAKEPIVAIGKSSGGMFANAVGATDLADAVVSYCAPGGADANAVTDAPTAWYLAEFDTTFPSGAADAADFQQVLTDRGLATDLYVHPTTPLYDQRFERVTGVDATTSQRIADDLRALGAVDAQGQWTNTGGVILGQLDLPNVLTDDQETAVSAEIEMMAADHELYDDVAARMVAWLDATL